jgi:serine protease Do
MNIHFPRLIASGLTIAGVSIGLNCLNAISPIELLNLTQIGSLSSHRVLAQQDVEEDVNIHVYQAASPAVVSIESGDGTGSGTIISPDGLILTNAHVVAGSSTVKVVLSDGTKLQGDVIAFGEAGLDLAAVKLQGQSNLPTVPIADPSKVAVGQRAFAIGDPFGQFQGTFTTGIVSRIDRNRGLIQTDTSINPGNSGGPLLNSHGELIGVNSAIFAPRGAGNVGIGFAISVERVQPFLTAVRDGTAPRVAQQSPMLGGGHKAQRITPNVPVEGMLDKDSDVHPSDSSYFNAYTFDGKAGQRVEIDMTSSEVDPYIILLAPDGQDLGHDDDGGGGSNARLTIALPADGTYTVLANTYQAGETGHYSLRLMMGNRVRPAGENQNTSR